MNFADISHKTENCPICSHVLWIICDRDSGGNFDGEFQNGCRQCSYTFTQSKNNQKHEIYNIGSLQIVNIFPGTSSISESRPHLNGSRMYFDFLDVNDIPYPRFTNLQQIQDFLILK